MTATIPPIWLLDVDGVLNAWDGNGTCPPGFRQKRCNNYQITYHPDRIARLRKMHEDGLVEIRWLTTWGSAANTFLGTIGVPTDLVVVAEPPHDLGGDQWWKLPHVRDLVAANPDRTFVWTDDDIRYYPEAPRWLRTAAAENVLAIAPDTNTGLTDGHLDTIEAWLKGWPRERARRSA
jgi:HAD domain in Swiss Army Knife RNA repair proteins